MGDTTVEARSMNCKRIISMAIVLALGALPLAAQQKWHQVFSPSYRVLTDDKIEHAQDATLRLEQKQSEQDPHLFGLLLQRDTVQCNVPLRILALGGNK